MSRRYLIICLSLAVILLLTGSGIYLLFRPASLLIFRFIDFIDINDTVEIIRYRTGSFLPFMPGWVIYSLPFTLYVLSYQFFIKSIWMHSSSLSFHFWYWSIPVIAFISEIGQSIHVVPGYFDVEDLLTLIFGCLFCFLILNRLSNKALT